MPGTWPSEGKALGLTTVLGGPHLTLMPEESISLEHPEVDYVIQGEADESILEFVDALEGRRAMETVHGLYWRKNGEIVVNPPSGLIPNLDSIPYPAHDLFKITPLHQPAAADRRAGHEGAGLHHHDQPRVPLQVHLLLQADHRRHLAAALGGERHRRVALAGERSARRPRSA